MTDLELIKQLEKEIGKELKEIEFKKIFEYGHQGFTIDENEHVIGLNLDKIKLEPLPASLSNLRHLKRLSLYLSQLKNISFLQGLSNLTHLNLSDNNITDISFLQDLSNLTHLDLRNNKIRELTIALIELELEIDTDSETEWGQKIYLHDNPLEIPPLEIIKKSKDAIKAYLRSLEEERLPLNEVKVLLVGDGGAGKTSLVRRLMGQALCWNPNGRPKRFTKSSILKYWQNATAC